MDVAYFLSPNDLRKWLKANCARHSELWIGFYKKNSGRPSVTYSEALDEALCFGWIDGVRKSIDAGAYTVRFTPRKAKSRWSAVNIKRVRKLIDTGRMHTAGLKAFEGAESQPRAYSYEQRNTAKLTAADERQFRANEKAWTFFQTQPPWYRRTTTWWVISAKKEETRQKRLVELISCSERQEGIKELHRPVPKR
jgi:uncharacterized protein YdeI (YjbR/CyaY-like superfamily)